MTFRHHKTTFLLSALLSTSTPILAQNVYTSGHADIGVAFEDEGGGAALFLHGHLGNGAIVDGESLTGDGLELAPGEFTTLVPESQRTTLPPGVYTPTGHAGELWLLPATNVADVPFLGFATEELETSEWSAITFSLESVVSPSGLGHFSVWQNGVFGEPNFFFSTAEPSSTLNGDNTLIMAPGGHDHYNMAFTEAGVWEVTLTVTGEHATEGEFSDTGTFRFQVVPEPGSAGLLLLGASLLGLSRRRIGR